MAKILTFRNKGDGCTPSDFLTDGSETLLFDTKQGGMFRLGSLSKTSLFPDPRKDWTNQELADLYRVHRLLCGANVPVETDRGITDEGDPWFVFCHASGEVFIHLCRIDGIYLLDSPNVLRPLRGADFRALIADFSNQSLPTQSAADESANRVIRLERGGKIRLHPSAMLAALIWTLFLASEDLVMLAPEEQSSDRITDDDGLLNFDGLFAAHSTDNVIENDSVDAEQGQMVIHAKDSGNDTPLHLPSDAPVHMREATLSQQGMTAHQNGFTIGLSTIAIAMGFMSEVLLLDDQRKVLDSLNKLGFSEYGKHEDVTADASIAADDNGSALMVMLQKFLGIELAFDPELSETATPDAKLSLLQQELKHLDDDALTANTVQPFDKQKLPPPLQDKIAEADTEAEAKPSEGAIQDASADPATTKVEAAVVLSLINDTVKPEITLLNLSEDIHTWQSSQLEEFQLGNTVIKASFDLSDVYTLNPVPTIEETPTLEFRVTNLYEYEGLAQRLVDFFTSKGSSLGFIEQDNGFIAVDREAVKGGDAEYIEWETYEGKSISVIGLPSDFQHFDMIA